MFARCAEASCKNTQTSDEGEAAAVDQSGEGVGRSWRVASGGGTGRGTGLGAGRRLSDGDGFTACVCVPLPVRDVVVKRRLWNTPRRRQPSSGRRRRITAERGRRRERAASVRQTGVKGAGRAG